MLSASSTRYAWETIFDDMISIMQFHSESDEMQYEHTQMIAGS